MENFVHIYKMTNARRGKDGLMMMMAMKKTGAGDVLCGADSNPSIKWHQLHWVIGYCVIAF